MMQKRVIAVLSLAALALTGCALDSALSNTHMDTHSAANGASQDASQFDADAVMFAQMMIPHHEQAVAMSDLAQTRTTNSDVLRIARAIRATQAPEIAQMRNWLQIAGADLSADHSTMDHGMDMGGMLTTEDMANLAAAQGKTFDELFLEGMIEHHRGAIAMSATVISNSNSEVAVLASSIVTAQESEISEMETLLQTIR